MQFKLIIYVSGKPSLNGYRIREFKWSEKHRKHLYLGAEIEPEKFNALFEKAWRNNSDLDPKAMVIPILPAPAAAPTPAPAAVKVEPAPAPAPAVVEAPAPAPVPADAPVAPITPTPRKRGRPSMIEIS